MWKRIVIAAVAVVVTGILAVVLSRPKEGTVEHHHREFIKAASMRGKWVRHAPKWVDQAYWGWRRERMEYHRRALFELGYLTRQAFVVSNGNPERVAIDVRRAAGDVFTNRNDITMGVLSIRAMGANGVHVAAPVHAMGKLGS